MSSSKLLFSVAIASIYAISGYSLFAVEPNSGPRITVVGVGEFDQKPDMAVITFSVDSEGLSAADAERQNASKLKDLKARLNQADLADANIQAMPNIIAPSVDLATRRLPVPHAPAYRVSALVKVQVHNLSALSELIDEMGRSSTARVSHVQYLNREWPQGMSKARQLAVNDARLKAELFAKAAGADLGEAVAIIEIVPPWTDAVDSEGVIDVAQRALPRDGIDRPLRAVVRITFALRSKN